MPDSRGHQGHTFLSRHSGQEPVTGLPEGYPLELWPLVSHPCLVKNLPGTVWPSYSPRLDRTDVGTVPGASTEIGFSWPPGWLW